VAIPVLVYTPLAVVHSKRYNPPMSLAPIRKNKKLSLAVVAARMGVTRSGVQRIEEAKNPFLFTLTRYAEAIDEDPLVIITAVLKESKKSVRNA
jgi:transcriptional regulator with XRE-family HTH domain